MPAAVNAMPVPCIGYKVEEKSSGIYTVTGDILPIQIINNPALKGWGMLF